MSETEHEQFEAEMRRLAPARPSGAFIERLRAARPVALRARPAARGRFGLAEWFGRWRWLALATPVAMAAVFLVRLESNAAGETGIQASGIQIDHQLVSTYDAVAQLPDGEPVRFRCQKWIDQVVLRDKNQRVVLQESSPRVEVVPVRFETY